MSPNALAPAFAAIKADRPARGLPIAKPPGHRERIVVETIAAIEKAHGKDRKAAEDTIEKYGLTIEVSRLRDRLSRLATTELQRLLLSTPGVPETLFNRGIAQALAEAKKDETPVQDASVLTIATQVTELNAVAKQLADVVADLLKGVQRNGDTGDSDGGVTT